LKAQKKIGGTKKKNFEGAKKKQHGLFFWRLTGPPGLRHKIALMLQY